MKTEIRISIKDKIQFADQHPYGAAGPYERLVGQVDYALDPNDPANQNVVDLDKAPCNARGLVEFSGDLDILKPVDLSKGNRRIFYDVNNRGNKTVLRSMNDGEPETHPTTLAHGGNGYLMRQGYTVVWSGWQGDLMPLGGLLCVELPEAMDNGNRLRGQIRQEFIAEQGGVLSMPVSGDPVIRCYEAFDLDTSHATFTRREKETDPRQPVSPDEWAFAKAIKDPTNGEFKVEPSATDCYIKEGFRPGWIYELVYETVGSRVMGLGLTGIRDLIAFLRYDSKDAKGDPNPLAGYVERAYSYGRSLSARVVRQSVYDGYNADPDGRQVFDGVYTHVSGAGRLFTNSRFSQVGRYPRQHEEHQWPSEIYPFAYSPVPDRFASELDSVLKRPESDPLVMHTHTGTEYWQRHASLGHTDPRTGDDLDLPENVRMYVLSSAQHAGSQPPQQDVIQQIPNTMTTGPFERAALSLLDRWASDGTPPPPSMVPRRSNGTLASAGEVVEAFPKVPGMNLPGAPSRLPKYDYGPDFHRGVITEHPPKPIQNQEYPVQVPQVDADGNDVGGLRSPELEAPVGTHTGWSLRKEGFAEGDLFSLSGSFVPFARTKAEKEATGDPRPSIQERYPNHAAYVRSVAVAAQRLVTEGRLLEEDANRFVDAAMKRNPTDPNVPLRPLVMSTA